MADSNPLYAQASQAAASGDKVAARSLLDELIFEQPDNEQAWLLLADMVEDLNEVYDCLQHVLAINPQNQAARQKLDALLKRVPELAELDPDKEKAEAAKKAEEAKKEADADAANGGLDLDHLDLTPLDGTVKPAKKVEEPKKEEPLSAPDPVGGLDLDHLDLTPLDGNKD